MKNKSSIVFFATGAILATIVTLTVRASSQTTNSYPPVGAKVTIVFRGETSNQPQYGILKNVGEDWVCIAYDHGDVWVRADSITSMPVAK